YILAPGAPGYARCFLRTRSFEFLVVGDFPRAVGLAADRDQPAQRGGAAIVEVDGGVIEDRDAIVGFVALLDERVADPRPAGRRVDLLVPHHAVLLFRLLVRH